MGFFFYRIGSLHQALNFTFRNMTLKQGCLAGILPTESLLLLQPAIKKIAMLADAARLVRVFI